MVDILHRVGISAPASSVYESLTTIDGLSRWWTEHVTGDPRPGGRIEFSFGGPDRRIVVDGSSTTPDSQVVWRCVDGGPDEWIGHDDHLRHLERRRRDRAALRPRRLARAGRVHGHCSTKWAYFLLGLKAGFEGGKATPFPDDVHISSWG